MIVPHAALLIPELRWDPHLAFTHLSESIDDLLELGVGGFILRGGTRDDVATLTGELHRRSALPLLIAADVARASRLIDQLQSTGARICMRGFSDGAHDQMRLSRLPSTYANFVSMSAPAGADEAGWPELRRKLIHESLRHGKIVVVERVDEASAIGELFRDNVHYVIGDGVGQWSNDMVASEIRLG